MTYVRMLDNLQGKLANFDKEELA